MLEILPSLVFLAIAFCGWGGLVLRGIGFRDSRLAGFGWSGLAGLAVAAVVGSALSFCLPLKVVALPFAFAGVLLFGIEIFLHRQQFQKFPWPSLSVLFLLCAVLAAREQIHGDTGLYHFQAVQWIAEEPVVAGLANLHGRFGFNSIWWVVAAMMQLPWLTTGQAAFFPVAMLGVFFGALVIDASISLCRRSPSAEHFVIVCAFYLWFRQLAGGNDPSIATDPPANLLGVATAACMVRACTGRDFASASLSVILATLVTATKLSAAVWLPGAVMGLLGVIIVSKKSSVPWRGPVFAIAFSAVLGMLWIARGIYCSGFPFYPTRLFGVPSLPWAATTSNMAKDFADVQSWPTRGTASLSISEMFSKWIENQYGFTNIIFVGCLLVIGLAASFLLRKVVRKQGWTVTCQKLKPLFFPLAIAIAGLCYCFAIAPAMRFASGYFFAGFGILFAMINLLYGGFPSSARIAILGLLAASAVALNVVGLWQRSVSWLSIPALPPPQVEERQTEQGITIRVNAPDGLAWNALRPSTPYFNPAIIFEFKKDGAAKTITIPR